MDLKPIVKDIKIDINKILEEGKTKAISSEEFIKQNALSPIDKDFKISNEVIFDDAYEMYIKNSKQLLDIDEESNVSSASKEFKEIISNTIRQDNKDISKSNGASISFILEYKDKKLLFLGDSHEDIILNSIKNFYKNDSIIKFDI